MTHEQLRPPRALFSRGQLFEEAADYVRELIVSGHLRPGERVKPEHVAERLGISTTPMREALHALAGEGFLRLEPRRGFTVARLTTTDIRDVYLALSLLAGELAARAAERLGDDDLDELGRIQAEIESEAARHDPELVEWLNHAFHRRINLAADAPKIAVQVRTLGRYAPRRFFGSVKGWPGASMHDHGALIDALRARDADGAREAMRAHIAHAGDLLARFLEDRLAAEPGAGAEPTAGAAVTPAS